METWSQQIFLGYYVAVEEVVLVEAEVEVVEVVAQIPSAEVSCGVAAEEVEVAAEAAVAAGEAVAAEVAPIVAETEEKVLLSCLHLVLTGMDSGIRAYIEVEEMEQATLDCKVSTRDSSALHSWQTAFSAP